MSSANHISRFGALAIAAVTVFLTAGLAEPEPLAPAGAGSQERFASLVSLARAESRLGLTGPQPAALPRGGSQFPPAAVPPELERLGRKVLAAGAPARFPVAGVFNWGQEGARFGAGRGGHVHMGQDLFGRAGTPLVAVHDGVVIARGDGGGRGNYVAIHDRWRRRTYVYLHLQGPARVGPGRSVRAGERIGELGCTGSCFGDHLHFEIHRGRTVAGQPLDPLPDLRRWARSDGARPTLAPGAH